eukprot:SAG22_NODE_3551_length_1648_cov_1.636540_2_plen_291_part_01
MAALLRLCAAAALLFGAASETREEALRKRLDELKQKVNQRDARLDALSSQVDELEAAEEAAGQQRQQQASTKRQLQTSAAGLTMAEVSDGPAVVCSADSAGVMYFDSAKNEFRMCTGVVWGPLQDYSPNHVMCAEGWGGVGCADWIRPPVVSCFEGTIAVTQAPNVFPHMLTGADVRLPSIVNEQPTVHTARTVTLTVIESDSVNFEVGSDTSVFGSKQWTAAGGQNRNFDFSSATVVADDLSVTVDVGTTTSFLFSVEDDAGQTASCTVDVAVTDIDECSTGASSCHEHA